MESSLQKCSPKNLPIEDIHFSLKSTVGNELDRSWHTSSHSRHPQDIHAPSLSPCSQHKVNSNLIGNSRGFMRDEGRQSSLGSVSEGCGVEESTRTLSIETHGINHSHHCHKDKDGRKEDEMLSDDGADDDGDSFGEASITEETNPEKLQKCLGSGVSTRLVNFRINYDSSSLANIEDVGDGKINSSKKGVGCNHVAIEHKGESTGIKLKMKKTMGSVTNALRHLVNKSNSNESRTSEKIASL